MDIVAFVNAAQPITADLLQGFANGEGGDTIVSIENLLGSSLADYLRGDDQVNELVGGGGDDLLEGRAGDDALTGGEGADSADGGLDTDDCDAEVELNCEL